MSGKEKLQSIRSGFLSRGLSLARLSLRVGSNAASRAVGLKNSNPEELNQYINSQVALLTNELGQLKGSLMKVGQLLSTYGEHFLPKEANELLKSLQFQSPPLAWSKIKQVLDNELSKEILSELEIDPKPYASASIGQVHRARRKSDGQELALKIQYPGVDKAVDTDLKFLKMLISLLNIAPLGAKFDQVFDEVKAMLYQEVDYRNELRFTQKFYDLLKDHSEFKVPKSYPEYCTQHIMCTEFLDGFAVDSKEVLSLSLKRRNALGKAYLDLYLRELLEFKMVQTDPHIGNYKIFIDPEGENDRLILLDFGAVREVPTDFLTHYANVMKGSLNSDSQLVRAGGLGLGLLTPQDPDELTRRYVELCFLITEPFSDLEKNPLPESLVNTVGEYKWGESDLPSRVAQKGKEIAFNFKLRSPPQETVFLDRKLGGAFIFLSVLKCEVNLRSLLQSRMKTYQ